MYDVNVAPSAMHEVRDLGYKLDGSAITLSALGYAWCSAGPTMLSFFSRSVFVCYSPVGRKIG